MGSESKYYKEIIAKLERLVKREYFLFAAIGIQSTVIVGILIFLSFSFLEAIFHLESFLRTILFLIFLNFTIGVFVFLFVIPILKYFNIIRKTDYYKVAAKAGSNFQFLKDDLLNAMQLVSVENSTQNYSVSLIDAAFLNVYEKAKSIRFESIVSFAKAKELFKYFLITLIISSALFLFINPLNAAAFRLLNFNQEFITPAKFTFEIHPGNIQLTKGNDISISIKVNGPVPKDLSIATKEEDQTKFEFQNLKRDSLGLYKYEVISVRNSFKYFAKADEISSEEFSVDVIDRPIIKTLDETITSPAYSKLSSIEQKDNGNITSLPGSNVKINISSTKNLNTAKLVFGDSTIINLKVSGDKAEGTFSVKKNNNYQIIITDSKGNENLSPITYSIKTLQDLYPSISLIAPDGNVNLPVDNRVNLFAKINDDYGFSKMTLNYRLSLSKYKEAEPDFKSVNIPIDKNSKEQDISYIWNLADMQLTENDVVTYYLEVFDNDNINGPKSSKTSPLTVRVPSLDEMISQADNTQNSAVNDLQETLQQAQDLKNELGKIAQDLRQNKKDISWDEKQKIEKTLDQFKKLQEKADEIGKKIDQMKNNLQQNGLFSKETLEKYSELQKLFDSLSTDEMKKAMENMQNLLQTLDRQQIQQAMENYKFNEEQFRAGIERTMNLLKRMQAEQKVNDLVNRIDQLAKKQEELQKDTKISKGKDKNELSEKQNDISKGLKNLKENMNDLSDKMKELKDLPNNQLDSLQQRFDTQENQQLSKEASEKIQQDQNQLAMQNQQQIMQNMQEMKKGMEQLQQSMARQSQVQTFLDMMKITDNLISLSKEQERLKNSSEYMDPNSSGFKRNSEQQNDIQNNLEKTLQQMSALSQKTFAITPEMGKALGDANRAMLKSLVAMQNRDGNQAMNEQSNAMKNLNEAASLMKSSMEQMMSGGQGQGGMMSLMQQMGLMTQQQINLNNLTQMLQQAMQGSMTLDQQAQLQRLAQQQELIRKSLDQLNNEAKASGQSRTLAASIDKMLQQMQEVVTNMKSQKLDDNVVQEQEHILSKMLDAQRSVNERDYEKERESFTGKDIVRESPAELNLSSDKGRNKIRDELNKAVQEGFSKDYEELIRKYYEALQKENVNSDNK
jgi:Domain of unknown function (DUF4175)